MVRNKIVSTLLVLSLAVSSFAGIKNAKAEELQEVVQEVIDIIPVTVSTDANNIAVTHTDVDPVIVEQYQGVENVTWEYKYSFSLDRTSFVNIHVLADIFNSNYNGDVKYYLFANAESYGECWNILFNAASH